MIRNLIKVLVMALIATGLTGMFAACKTKEKPGPEVLVMVNGEPIRTRDLQRAWISLEDEERKNYLGPEGVIKLLDELITWKLMAQEAESRRLDEDISLQDMLTAYKQHLLVNALINQAVTDADIYKYYQERFLRGLFIRVRFAEDASDKDKAKAKKEIDKIYSELQNGTDFVEFFTTKSDPTKGINGGDIGYVSHEMVSENVGFKAAEEVFGLKEPGSYTEPQEGKDGYYIFQLLEPPGSLDPTGLNPEFQKAIKEAKREEVIRSFANELESRPDNEIEKNRDAIRQLIVNLQMSRKSVSPEGAVESGKTSEPVAPAAPGDNSEEAVKAPDKEGEQ